MALRERTREPVRLPWRRAVLQLAAAAIVVFAAVGLWRSGVTRPEPPPKFRKVELVVNRAAPGLPFEVPKPWSDR
jgi:hypothetical protein